MVALVPDVWGGTWTVRHHVLTRLARYFRVLWVNPAGPWREAWFGRYPRGGSGVSEPLGCPVSVYTPGRWEAQYYRPAWLARRAERRRYARAADVLRRQGCGKLIGYLWRPAFEAAFDVIDCHVRCYHMDDEYTFRTEDGPIDSRESRLLARADHVFVHSQALLEKKAGRNPNTYLLPMGADYDSFATAQPEPADLASIPRPRIGYAGYIKGQLDFDLMGRLARMHPEWSFVFVGPLSVNLRRHAEQFDAFARLPNVHLLGGRDHTEVPAYVQHMDVLGLCYQVNDYTKYISPMKLPEYLATGRPVVGAPIRYLRGYSDVIALATTVEQWSHAITRALTDGADDPERVRAGQRVAQSHDWGIIVHRIARILCEGLGGSCADRIAAASPAAPGGPTPQSAASAAGT